MAPLFAQAETIMEGFFGDMQRHPERGEIKISGVRYLLMRTESFSLELHEELRKTFGDAGARQIRYKIAKACGMRDAKMFHERLGVTDPTMRLALGPVHFAHVGWAFVDIFPESTPAPDESYFIVYDHPYSFEAAAYLDNGKTSKQNVCFMNAGYSAGWCEVSFGLELVAEEITCRAAGAEKCVFVMAPPKHIDGRIKEWRDKLGVA
jgi:son of sevenless-like protein